MKIVFLSGANLEERREVDTGDRVRLDQIFEELEKGGKVDGRGTEVREGERDEEYGKV